MEKVSYPVYRGPIIVGLIVICCFGWWWWRCPCYPKSCVCESQEFQEIIIGTDCLPIPWVLNVTPGAMVAWTNLHADTMTVKFKSTSPFAVDYFWIPPGHQLTLKVKDDAPESGYDYFRKYLHDGVVVDCEGGTGGPTVNVGGGGG